MFALHTDQPSLVHLPQQRLALSAGASAFVEVVFQARPLGAYTCCTGVFESTLQLLTKKNAVFLDCCVLRNAGRCVGLS